jgi:hypothetical protein
MSQTTGKTRRAASPRNTRLPAVSGSARLLQPIGTIGKPEHRTGEIEVTSQTGRGPVVKAYYVAVHDTGYRLVSWDDKRKQVVTYDLPADVSSCDCPDFTSRADRREDHTCKHCKAIKALIGRGKLPAVAPVCAPCHQDAEADALADRWTDDTGVAETEADAFHSQFDGL